MHPLEEICYRMLRVLTKNGRQVLSVPSRAGGNYIRLMNQGPGNDITVVNQFNSAGDQLALQVLYL